MTKVAMTAVGGGPAWNSMLTGGLVAKTRLQKRMMRILKKKKKEDFDKARKIIVTDYISRRRRNLHDD